MSTWIDIPLEQLINQRHILSRIEALEDRAGARPSLRVVRLQEISGDISGSVIPAGAGAVYFDSNGITIRADSGRYFVFQDVNGVEIATIFHDGSGNLQIDLADNTKALTVNDGNIIVNHGTDVGGRFSLYENNVLKATMEWDPVNGNVTVENFESGGDVVFAVSGGTPASENFVFWDRAAAAAITTIRDILAGWTPSAATWSYSSADDPTFVISINADVTALIQPGDRIKLTQTTEKFFIVTAVGAYSGGATLVTVYGGTDYDLANAAISSPFYSHAKAPFGFPVTSAKWTVTVTDTSLRTQSTPTINQWYNLGSASISIPVGVWNVSYSVYLYGTLASAGTIQPAVTLSTANNSESDAATTKVFAVTSATFDGVVVSLNEYLITAASKTSYYLNSAARNFALATLANSNDVSTLTIKAVCAYL